MAASILFAFVIISRSTPLSLPHNHIAIWTHSHIATWPQSHMATQPHRHEGFQKGGAAEGRPPCVEAAGGRSILWPCGYVAMCLCGYVAAQLYGHVARWPLAVNNRSINS